MNHDESASERRALIDGETVLERRRLLAAGGAVGFGVSTLLLPTAASATSVGGSGTTVPESAAPSFVGATFYMFPRSDRQISVGWARAASDDPFTYNITIELISDGDPGVAPTPVPGAVVTVNNEAAMAPGSPFSNSNFWTIGSLWAGAWALNNGSVIRATLVSNTSPTVTVILERAWPMGAGQTLSITQL